MLHIGVCDDAIIDIERIKDVIKEYLETIHQSHHIMTYQSLGELLSEKDALDVLFLDIEMEKNAIPEVQTVLDKWPKCQIVYVTHYITYATDVYDTQHVYFVLKENLEKYIEKIFKKVFHVLAQENVRIVFKLSHDHQVSLMPQEILYFERDRRKTIITTTTNVYMTPEKVSSIYARLPEIDFLQCHNSYVVYIPAIKEIYSDVIIMNDGSHVPVSRRYKDRTQASFITWSFTQNPYIGDS